MPATTSDMTAPRPYALLAEVTYRCPLHLSVLLEPCSCPQCGGYSDMHALNGAPTTAEWKRVICDAATLGVLQIGFSGGEPLARPVLAGLVHSARAASL